MGSCRTKEKGKGELREGIDDMHTNQLMSYKWKDGL